MLTEAEIDFVRGEDRALCPGTKKFEINLFTDGGGMLRVIEWGIKVETGERRVEDAHEWTLRNELPVSREDKVLFALCDPARKKALLLGWRLWLLRVLMQWETTGMPSHRHIPRAFFRTAKGDSILRLLARKRLVTEDDFFRAIAGERVPMPRTG